MLTIHPAAGWGGRLSNKLDTLSVGLNFRF